MIADAMSLRSSQGSEERSLVLHLLLTTFAGEEIQLAIDLQEYDRLTIWGTAAPLVASCNSFIRTPTKCWLTPFGTLCVTITVST